MARTRWASKSSAKQAIAGIGKNLLLRFHLQNVGGLTKWSDVFKNNYQDMQKFVVPAVPLVPRVGEQVLALFSLEPKYKSTKKRFGSTGPNIYLQELVEQNYGRRRGAYATTCNQYPD